MKYEYIGEQSITIHGNGESGARMSEIELPEPYMWSEYRSIPPRPPVALYTTEQVRAAILAERERCARVCDGRVMGDNNREDEEAKRCAAAIRRGSV